VYAAAIGLHMMELIIPPPSRYPDLYPVLNVLVCTPVFVLTWLWSIKSGIEVGWALGGLGSGSGKPADRRLSIVSEASSADVRVGSHGRTVSVGSLGQGTGNRRRGPYNSRE
jgi:alpha-1,3-glucosyltransferase